MSIFSDKTAPRAVWNSVWFVVSTLHQTINRFDPFLPWVDADWGLPQFLNFFSDLINFLPGISNMNLVIFKSNLVVYLSAPLSTI